MSLSPRFRKGRKKAARMAKVPCGLFLLLCMVTREGMVRKNMCAKIWWFGSFLVTLPTKTEIQKDIMATIILQVPDESLVPKVKQACKMLMGVASVKIQREKAKPQLYDPETGLYLNDASIKVIEDAVKGKGVTQYNSLKDFYKEMGL